MTLSLPPFDLASLHGFYGRGGSVVDVIEAVYARIAAVNDPGIFIHLAEKQDVLARAAELGAFDPAKPLFGIPFAVKDNIDVADMPTTAACPDFAYLPEQSATVVTRLQRAGALVIGKTNLDQFATGLVGIRSPYPAPKNAIHPALVPGGSSSGSAVATAHGIVSFALGTDTAGSGRIPAGLNNVVGLKPSLGAISTTGVVPACRTLDCVSIFALTVADAWKVLCAASSFDETDQYSRAATLTGFGSAPPVLTIGVPAPSDRRFFGDEAMQAAYSEALAGLATLGHRIVDVPFADFHEAAELLYGGAWVAERYTAIRDFFEQSEEKLHPITRAIYSGAKALTAADVFEGFYALQALKRKIAPVLASVDLLCVPTAPTHYTVAELAAEPMRENSRLGTYTNFVNLLDLCGIAVPTGKRADGLPASITLLAPSGHDGLAATVAHQMHQASGLALGATGWTQPADDHEMIDIVVVGAHLSGMPLNHQLTSLNGSFAKATKTAAAYRLYALADTSPPRPGLVRVAQQGAEIDVEIWKLAPASFGRFVASIPAPLAIGTIQLSDGSSAKGFIAEPLALTAATDITGYGGWRAYQAELCTEAVSVTDIPSG